MIKRAIILVLMMCLFPVTAVAADWYVNPICSRNGDGTSPECADVGGGAGAWFRMDYVVWGTGGVQAGDTLYICSDTTRRARVGVSGTAENPITIRPLPGKSPVLSTYYRYPNPWQDLGDGRFRNVYYTGNLVQDGVFQPKASDISLTDGVFFSQYEEGEAHDVTYYRPPAGTTPDDHDLKTIWARAPFDLQGHDYFIFKDLHFSLGQTGIKSDSNDAPKHIEVLNCKFEDYSAAGISLRSYGGDEIDDIVVKNCIFIRTGQDIFCGSHADGSEKTHNIVLTNNIHYDTYQSNNPGYTLGDCGSLSDGESYGVQNCDNVTIKDNVIIGTYKGIVLWANAASGHNDITVTHNKVYNCLLYGIYLQPEIGSAVDNVLISYNIVTGLPNSDSFSRGLCFNNTNSNTARYINNTVIGFDRNIFFGHHVTNVIAENNLSYNPVHQHVSFAFADTDASGVLLEHNLYYPDGDEAFESNYHTYHNFSNWRSVTGKDGSSILSNPLLTGFHINSYKSPAIDGGLKISGIHGDAPNWTQDIDMQYIMNTPDIGCDEYHIAPKIGGSLIK